MVNTISLITSLFLDVMNVNVAVESGFRSHWSDIKRTKIAAPDSIIWNRGKSKKKILHAQAHTIQPLP
jgi:lipid A disaccharide synthetase